MVFARLWSCNVKQTEGRSKCKFNPHAHNPLYRKEAVGSALRSKQYAQREKAELGIDLCTFGLLFFRVLFCDILFCCVQWLCNIVSTAVVNSAIIVIIESDARVGSKSTVHNILYSPVCVCICKCCTSLNPRLVKSACTNGSIFVLLFS